MREFVSMVALIKPAAQIQTCGLFYIRQTRFAAFFFLFMQDAKQTVYP